MDISSDAVKQLIGDLYLQNAALVARVQELSDALSEAQGTDDDK
jgi:hypothetical protein